MKKFNLIKMADSYKVSHYSQYPEGTEKIYSYFECRGFDKSLFGTEPGIVFYGLQYFLKEYLTGQVITREDITEAEEFYKGHFFGLDLFYKEGWEYILNQHGGKLPIKIKAVLEGSIIPIKNVLFTIENTDPKCFWLTNFLETVIQQVWYPCTVATLSRETKKIILKNLYETGSPTEILFKLHDFGFRGASSVETAALGGSAHMINFMGSDTVIASDIAYRYYNLSRDSQSMPIFSIPATEHSTMTSWGKEQEVEAYRTYLKNNPRGIIACVSDSWDYFNACANIWGGILKEEVLSREGTLVIRPDSGDPVETTLRGIEILMDKFGFTINKKGYKVLPPQVRLIWGDGINIQGIENILNSLKENKISGDNIAFGMGGGLLQKVNRDSLKVAIKCSYAIVNGEGRNVYKDPATQPGKKSKMGKLSLHKVNGKYYTEDAQTESSGTPDELVTVFENGNLLIDQNFSDIKDRAAVTETELQITKELI